MHGVRDGFLAEVRQWLELLEIYSVHGANLGENFICRLSGH
jgi:hypothetical protein